MTAPTFKPQIHRLVIQRFRGIEDLLWHPDAGLNVILGGGDVGKTTILEAVGLLLSPTNPTSLTEADYYGREISAGFCIEAVVSLPPHTGVSTQTKPCWPWSWNGSEAVVPATDVPTIAGSEAVYVLRVRGTPDFELSYEILQPDGETDSLSIVLRRGIGLVRLSGDDRNDRDLRLVQGSALDRLLSDAGLRSRLARKFAEEDVTPQLREPARDALELLDATFRKETLPGNLQLAITGGQGPTIAALIGLTAEQQGVQLPLGSWGAGTRRLASLAIAKETQGGASITVVDELERGLEPYRQRRLVRQLELLDSQVFITTHSSAVLSASEGSALWYLDHAGRIGKLDNAKIASHRKRDPETFLSRLSIVAEGITEVGFLTKLLETSLGCSLERYGVHITDGGGHEATLELLEGLGNAGIPFGAFADDEGKHPSRWQRLLAASNGLVFRWRSGCLEENVIGAVPEGALEALLVDATGRRTGDRLRTLADRLNLQSKDFVEISEVAGLALRQRIIEAAIGRVPPGKENEKKLYEGHARQWFKTESGGRELAEKALRLGAWSVLEEQLSPFLEQLRAVIGHRETLFLPR